MDRLGTVVGIDPGINTLGLSLVNVDVVTNDIKNIEAMTIKPADAWIEDPYSLSRTQGEITRDEKLKYMSESILRVLQHNIVTNIVLESPFYNKKTPLAYGSLVEQINIFIGNIRVHYPYVPISMFAPRKIKKIIGAEELLKKDKSLKHKGAVKQAILNNKHLIKCIGSQWDDLDEHAIDAIAVAITQIELG